MTSRLWAWRANHCSTTQYEYTLIWLRSQHDSGKSWIKPELNRSTHIHRLMWRLNLSLVKVYEKSPAKGLSFIITPIGIEPMTSRLWAWRANHCSTTHNEYTSSWPVSQFKLWKNLKKTGDEQYSDMFTDLWVRADSQESQVNEKSSAKRAELFKITPIGIEPMTSRLWAWRANHCSTAHL